MTTEDTTTDTTGSAETSPTIAASDTTQEAQPRDLRTAIDEWFFNYFHQPIVLNHPDVFTQAQAAKGDLLKLLALDN